MLQVVVFSIGEGHYALPIQNVREIVKMQKITSLPEVGKGVLGITNLRGNVIPLIDTSEILNSKSNLGINECKIVVVYVSGREVGFVVDDVEEVITVKDSQISTVRILDNKEMSVIKHGEKLLLILDEDILSQRVKIDFEKINIE